MLGGDAFYCAGSLDTIAKLAAEGIPGDRPCRADPVERDLDRRLQGGRQDRRERAAVYDQVRRWRPPAPSAPKSRWFPPGCAEISKRTSLVLLSMGAGVGGDAQYLFAEDVLGYTRGHQPRHAKVYRNFRAEYDRLQQERIAAFKEFRADVETGGLSRAEAPRADRRRRIRRVSGGIARVTGC